MGLIEKLLGLVFGSDRNVVAETAEVFLENTEAGAVRSAALQTGALVQHGQEFSRNGKGWFDRFMDGVNRLPRPALALGTLALFIAAMVDPLWFGARMQGLALVPEPLWWLLGAIVSFYFGARHQNKSQEFQRSLAETMSRVPQVVENIQTMRRLRGELTPGEAADDSTEMALELSTTTNDEDNPAVADWRAGKGQTS